MIEQNIKQIKNAGFGYIKLEVECNTYADGDIDYDYATERISEDLEGQGIDLKYIDCFNDGSVDFECTLTISVDQAGKIPQIIDSIKSEIDYKNQTNAGFHISVLKDSEYPCYTEHDQDKLINFKEQVKKLMPALIFLSASRDKTRSFYYRKPRIAHHNEAGERYSMINILTGGFEYRMFDPCLHKSELSLEYINVIAQTLKYYSKRKLKKNLYELYTLEYNESTEHIGKYFGTTQNQTALRACLPYIISDKRVIAEKTKKLPKPSRTADIRDQIRLLKQYDSYIKNETENRRTEMIYQIRRAKEFAREYRYISFNKRSIKADYRKQLKDVPTFEQFKTRASRPQQFTFKGSV